MSSKKPRKETDPDVVARKAYGVPIGEETRQVGPQSVGKVMIACIDEEKSALLGISALMFHDIYTDVDGKCYTDAVILERVADALRWSKAEEFLDTTEVLNSIVVRCVLGRIRAAVVKGELKPEPEKKKKRKLGSIFQISKTW